VSRSLDKRCAGAETGQAGGAGPRPPPERGDRASTQAWKVGEAGGGRIDRPGRSSSPTVVTCIGVSRQGDRSPRSEVWVRVRRSVPRAVRCAERVGGLPLRPAGCSQARPHGAELTSLELLKAHARRKTRGSLSAAICLGLMTAPAGGDSEASDWDRESLPGHSKLS